MTRDGTIYVFDVSIKNIKMIATIKGVVVSAPEQKEARNGNPYWRVQVKELSTNGYGGKKTWCYAWDFDKFDLISRLQEQSVVEINGTVSASTFAVDGKQIAVVSLSVTGSKILEMPPAHTVKPVPFPDPPASGDSDDIPF